MWLISSSLLIETNKITGNLSMIEKRYYRSNEAANYLGVNEKTIRKWARENLLQYSRPGGKILLFDKRDLDAFIEKHRSGGNGVVFSS
jgi:excisionase family DNA binding protein